MLIENKVSVFWVNVPLRTFTTLIMFINNVHKKQLLTYLKLTELKLGYLLNFGEALMKDGIIRVINGVL